MTLSRSLSKIFIPNPNTNKWSLIRSSSPPFSTETLSKRTNGKNVQPSITSFPKPSEIPFQSKVSNLVHLVGSIGVPIKIQSLPGDGVCAVSVLVQESRKKDCPQLCIPVIFQGDLAEIAACHLKEKDLVYVTGQLSADVLPITVEDKHKEIVRGVHNHLQVLANSLNFVKNSCLRKESEMVHDQDDTAFDGSAEIENNPSKLDLWNDLFAHPNNWLDNRSSKSNPACATFRHKKSGELLCIDDSTPEWVQSKLDNLSFREIPSKGVNRANGHVKSLWSGFVDNPQEWWDMRMAKLNKKVSPKFPDFKHKSTEEGLWLDRAPDWVLSKLDGLVFCGIDNARKSYHQKRPDSSKSSTGKSDGLVLCDGNNMTKSSKEDLWKSLVENPKKWWDNRSSKLKPNHPDFKHKDTGEALWLGPSTPSWVLPKLPPGAPKQDAGWGKSERKVKSDTLLS